MKRSWFIASAAGLAVVAAVGSFLIAAPFAAPQSVAPVATEAWELPQVSPLTPLGEGIAADGSLPATVVTSIDPSSPAVLEEQLRATVDRLEAATTSAESETSTLGPPALSTILPTPIDPCIALGPSTEGCEGVPATVLPVDLPSAFRVRAQTNFTCATGPGESSISFIVWVTDVGTVEVEYDVDGEPRWATVRPRAEDLAAFEAEERIGGWLRYCVQLTDLPADWSDTVIIRAFNELGERADTEAAVSLATDDDRAPFWVEPYSSTTVVMSVATSSGSVRFRAFIVPFGQPAPTCDFDDEDALEPAFAESKSMTEDFLIANNYSSRWPVRHSAIFSVPEASTIAFCVGVVNGRTSWPTNVPQELFSEVLHSPDLTLPVVTVEEWRVDDSVDSPNARVTATIGGTSLACGWRSVGSVGPFCDYRGLRTETVGWDRSLVITSETTAFGSTGTRTYHLPVYPQICGVGCVPPEPAYFDIRLESREPCLGNGCAPSYLGVARLKVEWIDGQDSWATGWWRDGAAGRAEGPVFDQFEAVDLGAVSADGMSQSVEFRIRTNEPTTARLTLDASTSSVYLGGAPRVYEDLNFTTVRTFDLDLEANKRYLSTLEVTDEDGNTIVYSPVRAGGARTWAGGYFETATTELDFDISVSAVRTNGGAFVISSPRAFFGTLARNPAPSPRTYTCSTASSPPITMEAPYVLYYAGAVPLTIAFDSRVLSSQPESGPSCEAAAVSPGGRYPDVLRTVQLTVPLVFNTTTTIDDGDFVYTVTIGSSRDRR